MTRCLAAVGARPEDLGRWWAQVATAVVSLVTNPDVGTAVHGLVDTLFTDFLGSFRVVPAISGAAGEVALAVFTGTNRRRRRWMRR